MAPKIADRTCRKSNYSYYIPAQSPCSPFDKNDHLTRSVYAQYSYFCNPGQSN